MVILLVCQDFTVQANDTSSPSHTSNKYTLHNITTQQERNHDVPIARLRCLSSLRFDKFATGSWDLSFKLSSLTVSDLTSHQIHTLLGRKQQGTSDTKKEHNACIEIRNVVSDDSTAPATTFFNVDVTPLEAIYSTNAFEALSRLFAAMKTSEFNRDYMRITNALSRWRSRQRMRLMSVLAKRKKLVVSVDIAAPVLFIPEDLQSTDSPMLVLT